MLLLDSVFSQQIKVVDDKGKSISCNRIFSKINDIDTENEWAVYINEDPTDKYRLQISITTLTFR